MPFDYGASAPVDAMPDDLRESTEAADAMIGDELAALIPPFEKPINAKVMTALGKAVADAAKLMGMDVEAEKYTAPVAEMDPDLVRFLSMVGAAADDYGSPIPAPDTLKGDTDITALTAAIIELVSDPGFAEFLDMEIAEDEAGEGGEDSSPVEEPAADDEEFDFSARMR